MKKIILLTLFTLGSFSLYAQILVPVKWSYAAKKINDKEAIVLLKATIDQGWHIYSQQVTDGGPVPTSFRFDAAKNYQLIGQTGESKPQTKYEKTFGMEVKFFEKSALFQQKVKLLSGNVIVKGKLEYMVCNDQKCLPPEEINFSIPVK